MNTHHHWFRSGSHTILAHIDVPTEPSRSGVIIVPPFGWDDICAYRPLRSLGRSLASRGIAALRYDLPGTGDSSGSALDPNLMPAWIRSVQDAVAELKAAALIEEVSVLGVRLGAMLALAAASAGANIDNLILWGAPATGRAVLRELRAFRNLEVTEYAEGELPPTQPIEGLEVAGFLLSRETESALEAFNTANLSLRPNQRVLLLTRDHFPHDAKLLQFLEKASCHITLKTGLGYQDMLAAPHEPLPFSPETRNTILDFLQPTPYHQRSQTSTLRVKFREERIWQQGGVVETVCHLPYKGGSLHSILAQPTKSPVCSDWGLLLMNAGGVRHIGPNRMWVEAARRWAVRGVPSMRVDFERVGESDGDQQVDIASLHGDDLVEQLSLAMASMHSHLNCRRFIAVGLCSGAFAAFQSIIRNPAIRGAILLNPRLFFWDPTIEPRRLAKRVGTGLADASYWRRLARGEIQPARIKQAAQGVLNKLLHNTSLFKSRQQIPAAALAHAWDQVERFQARVTLVFADGEPLIEEMLNEKQLPPGHNPRVNCVRVGKVGHTFRALWAQQMLHDLLDREIDSTIQSEGNVMSCDVLPEGVSAFA